MFSAVSQAMWNRSSQLLTCVCRSSAVHQLQQQRNVVVVRRLFPPPVPKINEKRGMLKKTHKVYILEEDTSQQPRQKMKLILTEDVPKIGNRGEVVMVDKRIGRNKLLPSGAAVYASPENLKEFALSRQIKSDDSSEEARLSPMAIKTIEHLKKNKLEVRMHAETEWSEITKDIIIHAFRHRLGTVVPEHALSVPEKPITEVGSYPITVTVNGIETIPMDMEVVNFLPKRRKRFRNEEESVEEAS